MDCLDRLRRAASRLRPCHHETPIMQRARETFELHDFGVAAYRQRMRRENPQATEAEIGAMVRAWLLEPPQDRTLPPPPRRRDNDTR